MVYRTVPRTGIVLINNQVDVGVRVEVPAQVFKHITDEVYEAKLVYRTRQYNDLVRTFCMNPNGYVVAENTDGIITVNGHSFRDPKLHSHNTILLYWSAINLRNRLLNRINTANVSLLFQYAGRRRAAAAFRRFDQRPAY